jgi:penicillin amidase
MANSSTPPAKKRKSVTRSLGFLAGLLLLMLASTTVGLYWRAKSCLPQVTGEILVSGLQAPVQVLRDARGVPHLQAQSLDDLFFVQGYVTAQDRLWQMDLFRRRAEGTLSEIFGKTTLSLDKETRRLSFPIVLERAVQELDPQTRRIFSAYATGVNAFILTHQNHLPVEFAMLRYQPHPWTAKDSLAVALNMVRTLNTTWPNEVWQEQILAKVGKQMFDDMFPATTQFDHPVSGPVAAERAMPSTKEKSKPRRRKIRRSASQTRADETKAATENSYEARQTAASTMLQAPGLSDDPEPYAIGSNNWVVSGAHTASGKPLLANDPHLGYSVPSIWYMIHLEGPGLDVAGVSLAGLPLIIIGHNQRIAWGMTNTGPDVQDLFIEKFKPGDPTLYLHNGRWEKAEVHDEVIRVRGAAEVHERVRITRHGPVVSHAGGRDLALAWTILQPHALKFPFLGINQAANWNDFVVALRDFIAPEQNFVYADVEGNIGYYAPGWIPIRKKGDGTVPVPGDTDDYDWNGMIPFHDLPHDYNPESGIIATANGRVVPNDYPYLITRIWEAAPFRTERIYQLLQKGNGLKVTDMQSIQMDIKALDDLWLAHRLLSAAAKRPPAQPGEAYAVGLLRDWDGRARAGSGAELVCRLTNQALRERILTPKLGPELGSRSWGLSGIFLQNVIDQNLTRWLPPDDKDFDETLMKSLQLGVSRIPTTVHSTERSAWRWGDTIPLTFRHPLAGAFPLLHYVLNYGPFLQSGNASTVKATTSTHGPSMRIVDDLSDFDNSVQNITLGESGQVFSSHYRDQFHAWYTGSSFPLLFTDQAVDAGAVARLTLLPASP